MLRFFVNTFSVDDKHSVLKRDNFKQKIHMQLCKQQKTFLKLFSGLFKSKLNLEHFCKKLTFIANVFLKLGTRKEALR